MFLIVAYLGSSSIKSINKKTSELENNIVPSMIAMIEIKTYAQETRARLFHYILVGNIEKICPIKGKTSTKKLILETGDLLKKSAEKHSGYEFNVGAEEKRITEEMENKTKRLNFAVVKIVDLKDRGVEKDKLLREMDILFQPEFNSLINIVSQHEITHLQELADMNKSVSQKKVQASRIILVFIILILFLPVFIGILIFRSVSVPIKKLQQGIKIVKKGNLDYEVGIDSKDEIGQLSRDFDKMTSSLKKSRNNVEKKIAQRTVDLEEINKRMVGRELKMVELKKEIKELKDKSKA